MFHQRLFTWFKQRTVSQWWLAVVFATWGLWFLSLWPQWLTVDARGIATSHLFMWGDWAAHFTYINHFRITPTAEWFVHNPIFSQAHFVYPPLSSIVSALLMRAGFSLWAATILPSIVCSFWLLRELWLWFRVGKLSPRAAYLGLSLLLLSGAWGWPLWLAKVVGGTSISGLPNWSELGFPTDFYTKNFDTGLDWVNPVVSMVLPQRAFLLGFPLFLFILRRLQTSLVQKLSSIREVVLGIDLGVLTFLLFLAHTHSFLSLTFLCAFWCLGFWRRWRFWLTYALTAFVLILPWYWTVMRGQIGVSMFSWHVGWMAARPLSILSWFSFWLLNWGWFLPLWVIALVWQGVQVYKGRQKPEKLWLTAPFFFLWITANIIQTQRWEWDNTKIFMAALVGALPLMLQFVSWLYSEWSAQLPTRRLRISAQSFFSVFIVLGVMLQVLPGVVDLLHLSQPKLVRWEMANAEDVAFAQVIEKKVPVDAIVLTDAVHNHPVSMLAGRTLLLGFKGWVWSYGLDSSEVDKVVTLMYTDIQQAPQLWRKYNVRYVVIGQNERSTFGEELAPAELCQEIGRAGRQALFDCAQAL